MQIAIIKDNAVERMGEHRELFKNSSVGAVKLEVYRAFPFVILSSSIYPLR